MYVEKNPSFRTYNGKLSKKSLDDIASYISSRAEYLGLKLSRVEVDYNLRVVRMRIDDSVVQVSLNDFADDLKVQSPKLSLYADSQGSIDTVLRKWQNSILGG